MAITYKNVSLEKMGWESLYIAMGTVGGLLCGYFVQWVYRGLLGYGADKINIQTFAHQPYTNGFGLEDGTSVHQIASTDNIPEPLRGKWYQGDEIAITSTTTADAFNRPNTLQGLYNSRAEVFYAAQQGINSPGFASAGNPILGMIVLMLLNSLVASVVLALLPNMSDIGRVCFIIGLIILELDDLLAFSHRIVAPIGGDPLRFGKDPRNNEDGLMVNINRRPFRPFYGAHEQVVN